jgi:hypothetical protein
MISKGSVHRAAVVARMHLLECNIILLVLIELGKEIPARRLWTTRRTQPALQGFHLRAISCVLRRPLLLL